jgi:hypothetical protein
MVFFAIGSLAVIQSILKLSSSSYYSYSLGFIDLFAIACFGLFLATTILAIHFGKSKKGETPK